MATSTGAFFAGVATTFVILGAGFAGGLMVAKSALQEPTSRVRASVEAERPPVRVILPASNESAQPPQEPAGTAAPTGPAQEMQTVKEVNQPIERRLEKADSKRAEAEDRERKRHYSERKAQRQAEARARLQQLPREHVGAPVMAFGGDDPARFSGSFFGN
jgi:hypothetical protein